MGAEPQDLLHSIHAGRPARFETAPQTQSTPALDRALILLELLGDSRFGLSLPQLVEKTSLPKSSVHCLLLTLERRGYLQRNKRTGRYQLGLKFLALANVTLSGIPIREYAAVPMKWLADSTGLTAHLAILESDEAVLISKHSPPGIFRLATWVGKRMDIHCTSLGKALIANLPEHAIERIIREHGLPRHNDQTLSSVKKLKADLTLTAARGYSVDYEEDEVGMCCIGAPIFDSQGNTVAAVSIAGSTEQIEAANLEHLAAMVKRAAAKIAEHLAENPATT
jgi:DNA-binding IclR family transcriptional regulator